MTTLGTLFCENTNYLKTVSLICMDVVNGPHGSPVHVLEFSMVLKGSAYVEAVF